MFNFQGKKLLPIKDIYVENEKNKKIKKGEHNLTVNISLFTRRVWFQAGIYFLQRKYFTRDINHSMNMLRYDQHV